MKPADAHEATCQSRSFVQRRSEVSQVSASGADFSSQSAVDVVIVGAGYSGLSVAHKLRQSNISFRVIEARHRLGGRILDEDISKRGDADDTIEIGGQWLHDTHSNAIAFMNAMGFDVYEPGQQEGLQKFPCSGCHGRVATSSGWLNASASGKATWPLSIEEMRLFHATLDTIWKEISETPCKDPLSNPNAPIFDSLSYDAYLRQHHQLESFPEFERVYGTLLDLCLEAEGAERVSALHCLWKANCTHSGQHAGGKFFRVRGGPQASLKHLASELQSMGSIWLSSEVLAIKDSDESDSEESDEKLKVVVTNTTTVLARHVVLAGLPPAQLLKIKFVPQLPEEVSKLLSLLSLGSVRKYSLVYKAPWWRARGYSGSIRYVNYSLPSLDPQRCFDNSPYSASRGVLTCMTTGDVNRGLQRLSEEARRAALQSVVHGAFGAAEADESPQVVDKDWSRDAYSGGANVFYPTGTFSSSWPGTLQVFFHHQLSSSIWIAGADYSHISHGYMNGAIGSGQAVAERLVQTLHA